METISYCKKPSHEFSRTQKRFASFSQAMPLRRLILRSADLMISLLTRVCDGHEYHSTKN